MKKLTDVEYEALKKALHHAHDKIWKIIFSMPEAMREYIQVCLLPKMPGIVLDLDHLELDNTSYVSQRLDALYSDLVYLTTIIDQNGTRKPVKIALLLEHKSEMPSSLRMRLQLLEYLSALKSKHYDEKTDSTLFVIPNIFNQFQKDWTLAPFRSLYPDLSPEATRFTPEFDVITTNLADLPPELILSLEQYGTLRAGLLAMKHAHNKRFLKTYFAEIFVFLERDPEKTALRNQLLTYLIGASRLTHRELDELLKAALYKPYYKNLKSESMEIAEGFIEMAARQTEERVRKEEQKKRQEERQEEQLKWQVAAQLKTRSIVMRLWHKKIAADVIVLATELSLADVEKLIKGFEIARVYWTSHDKRFSKKKIAELAGITLDETTVLINVLKKNSFGV
jgi:Putative transposase, YhgA-like